MSIEFFINIRGNTYKALRYIYEKLETIRENHLLNYKIEHVEIHVVTYVKNIVSRINNVFDIRENSKHERKLCKHK